MSEVSHTEPEPAVATGDSASEQAVPVPVVDQAGMDALDRSESTASDRLESDATDRSESDAEWIDAQEADAGDVAASIVGNDADHDTGGGSAASGDAGETGDVEPWQMTPKHRAHVPLEASEPDSTQVGEGDGEGDVADHVAPDTTVDFSVDAGDTTEPGAQHCGATTLGRLEHEQSSSQTELQPDSGDADQADMLNSPPLAPVGLDGTVPPIPAVRTRFTVQEGNVDDSPERTKIALDTGLVKENEGNDDSAFAEVPDNLLTSPDHDRRVQEENEINQLKTDSVSAGMGRVQEDDQTPQSGRRLIKADPSLAVPCSTTFDDDDDDDPDFPETPATPQCAEPAARGGLGLGYRTTGGPVSSHWHQNTDYDQEIVALDLATQRVSFKSDRRHTLGGSDRPAAMSRPGSALSDRSGGSDDAPPPHQPGSHVASELQRQFLASSQWTDMECLSLTLEEVVHIRSVLTKAELDSLPVECHIKEDVARGKLCFLCMKTRFSFFGAKGHNCRLCQRVVCAKCCAKMRIPTEHFASIPVYTLTPSSLSPQEEEARSLLSRLQVPEMPSFTTGGSDPTSPNLSRQSPEQTQSLPPQPLLQQVESKLRRARLYRSRTLARPEDIDSPKSDGDRDELAGGVLMTVCKDCKAMVLHIIVTWKKRRDRSKRASAPARPRSLFIAAVH
ncbi:uncharacterized protein LOC119105723 isoform X4 [Pollicipes pollicipes]|uniref:uncharacterized protein LOC119105723 isoform X4 n=1 Tax=Pollicipes pollicipes TaxID=41117 RepID=UPI00188587F2|nr:uncharacterized protein LOC119105723 isoform X4 [Pollicipes pollicipes]